MLSSSLGSQTQPPTPSPRRKISNASFNENLEYATHDAVDDAGDVMPKPFQEFRLGAGQAPLYGYTDYLRNEQSYSNENSAYVGAHRTAYFGEFCF